MFEYATDSYVRNPTRKVAHRNKWWLFVGKLFVDSLQQMNKIEKKEKEKEKNG